MRGLADHLMRFAPIGLCFAASLSLGNAAYLYISVAFVQMLKAGTPVATLLVSIVLGLERPSCRLAFYILLVSSGIGVACAAQVHPSVPGVLLPLCQKGFAPKQAEDACEHTHELLLLDSRRLLCLYLKVPEDRERTQRYVEL